MQTIPIIKCIEETALIAPVGSLTIRCYMYPPLVASALRPRLPLNRELSVQAMSLLLSIDSGLREARADWNEDRFRRLMRLRPRAVRRLHRRWDKLDCQPVMPLGSLRRRYHANIAGYLHAVAQH